MGEGMAVDCDPIVREIVRDETITRGLGDEEARLLIEWVVDWAELLSGAAPTEDQARQFVHRLSRRARVISRFVQLWCDPANLSHAAAIQLAASERLSWPFPVRRLDPPDLMDQILRWENDHLAE